MRELSRVRFHRYPSSDGSLIVTTYTIIHALCIGFISKVTLARFQCIGSISEVTFVKFHCIGSIIEVTLARLCSIGDKSMNKVKGYI